MSKPSRWPPRTKHAAFRMVEDGLDRTLQAEVHEAGHQAHTERQPGGQHA